MALKLEHEIILRRKEVANMQVRGVGETDRSTADRMRSPQVRKMRRLSPQSRKKCPPWNLCLGAPPGSLVWELHLESSLGSWRSTWELRLEFLHGSFTWKVPLEVRSFRWKLRLGALSGIHLAVSSGSSIWNPRLGAGSSTWELHLESSLGSWSSTWQPQMESSPGSST